MSGTVKKILLVSIIILVGIYIYFSYQINTGKYKHPLDPSNTAVLSEADKSNKYKEFFSQFVSLDLLTVDMSSFSNSKIKEFIDTKILSKDSLATNRGSSVTITPPSQQPVGDIVSELNDINDFNLTRVTTKTSQFINTTRPVVKPRPTTPTYNLSPVINKPVEQPTPTVPTPEKPVVPTLPVQDKKPEELTILPGIPKKQDGLPTLTAEEVKKLPVVLPEKTTVKIEIENSNNSTGLSYPTAVAGIVDNTEAKRVIDVIKNNCGVDLSLSFDIKKDTNLPPASYKIRGSQVTYNSDTYNNTAVYAIARASEDILKAFMLKPGDDGIICKNKPTTEQIKNVLTFYSKDWQLPYFRTRFVDSNLRGGEVLWFQWNHIPYKSMSSLYKNRLEGLAIKYPHLTPFPPSEIKEETKINLLHDDLPKILYDEWIANGKPKEVRLFESDGTGFVYADQFPMPEGLNKYEQGTFKGTVSSGQPIRFKYVDGKFSGSCNTSPDGEKLCITEYFGENIKKWLPFYQATKNSSERIVLTPIYFEGYKKIENYFIQNGATDVRFLVYAYSAYYYIPPGTSVPDLSNFDVYYVSPAATEWNSAEMERDLDNFNNWKRSGARMIWAPNLWHKNNSNFMIHNEFVYRAKPDGFAVAGYTANTAREAEGVIYYSMFRILQGRTPDQALDDYNTNK